MGRTETVELWMCRLAGLPVSECWERPPGPPSVRQIAVTALSVGGFAFLVTINALKLTRDQDYDGYTTYEIWNSIILPAAAIFITLNMASGDRSAPKRLAVRAECLREAMITHGVGVAATDLCRTASRFLLTTALTSIFCNSLGDGIHEYDKLLNDSATAPNAALSVLVFIIKMQALLLFWTVLYRSASQPLAELGIIEDVIRELPSGPEPEEESDPETEPDRNEAPEEDPGHRRPRPPLLTVHRCRLLIALCDQANKLRLESNRWLHQSSCAIMFATAWHLPKHLRDLISSPQYLFPFHMALALIGAIEKLAPMCCAQLVKHRREALVRKAAREADRTADPELRRALNKLKIHAEEMFPDSLCVLLDFDLSLFPVLVNVVVLVATTFFQRDGT